MNLAQIRTPEYALFYCRVNPGVDIQPGGRYVVEFDYGMDEAEVIEYGELKKDVKDFRTPGFRVERRLNAADLRKIEANQRVATQAEAKFQELLRSAPVQVKLVHTRLSLDGRRIFFRYFAKSPVNLNRFAEPIQRCFNADVNIWQIGVRDECRLTGCIGCCGRQSCCSSWQKRECSVNLRMAKTQGIPLNPASLNGTCNRLKCCLKYENHVYAEAGADLPDNGTLVSCSAYDNLKGIIINRDILRGRVVVKTQDGRFLTLPAAEVAVVRQANG